MGWTTEVKRSEGESILIENEETVKLVTTIIN